MHKNKFATPSGMCRAIMFLAFWAPNLNDAKFGAPTNLFFKVADPTNT